MRSTLCSLILLFVCNNSAARADEQHHHDAHEPAMLQLPASVEKEHQHLHESLERATKERGPIGEAAAAVAKVLQPHFEREEEFALPPLALLPVLARSEATPEMKSILPLTDKLEAELKSMLSEHKTIVEALEKLRAISEKENRQEYVEFVDALTLHAQHEEDILYPAAILVGKYLKAAR